MAELSEAQKVIVTVLASHIEDGLTNYDTGRNECGCCTQRPNETYHEHLAAEIDNALARTTEDVVARLLQGHVFWNDERPDGNVRYWCGCGKDMSGSIEWSAHVAEAIANAVPSGVVLGMDRDAQ